jgi:hypothetical protein
MDNDDDDFLIGAFRKAPLSNLLLNWLDKKFTTGKHAGKTLKEVIQNDIAYLEWYCINDTDFIVDLDLFNFIKVNHPDFSISAEAQLINTKKLNEFNEFMDRENKKFEKIIDNLPDYFNND